MSARDVLVLASLLSLLGCEPAVDPGPSGELETKLAALEQQNAALVAERDQLAGQLAACRDCRTKNIEAFDAFGTSSAYAEATDDAVDDAIALLDARLAARKPDEKLALVLDIDETVLSNFEQLDQTDYCFDRNAWNAWVETGKPKPIAGAARLYAWAKERGLAIVFLTGRTEPQRPATERALREAGFGEWTELILRGPDENELEAGEFKSARRAKLEAAGYVIALTVGDQASDLSGGHSEATLLMPNPFYMVK
jgi:5'-nucleotidase (lipoprotein e(P4) family)